MPTRTYVAQRPGAFAALVQATHVAGYRLEPLATARLRDHYYDTSDGDLLRQGLCLRVREGTSSRAVLRPIREDDDGPHAEADAEPGRTLRVPPGPLADALARLTESADPAAGGPLVPLLSVRTDRAPRAVYDGARLVGVLSFDVAVLEMPDGPHATNELAVELADTGVPRDLDALDPALRAEGLAPADLSAFERGVAALPRALTEPLLLLPHERDLLTALSLSDDPVHQRRATVLLLDARGFRSSTIAREVGLSTARVRHWKQLFREQRLRAFGEASGTTTARPRREAAGAAPGALPAAPAAAGDAAGDAAPIVARPPASLQPPEPLAAQAPPKAPPPPGAAPAAPDEAPPATTNRDASGSGHDPERSAISPRAAGGMGLDGDLDDLLDFFRPGPTGTPVLLDEDPSDDGLAAVAAARTDATPAAHKEPPGSDGGLRLPTFAPLAPVDPPSASRAAGAEQAPEASGDTQEANQATGASRPPRARPRLHPDDPLVDAALSVLTYHVGQLTDAAADARTAQELYRLYLATHRVRLALEVFAPVLPSEAVASLHRGLRPLAKAVDPASGARGPTSDADRAKAAGDVREVVTARAFAAWRGQAGRLLGGLRAQQREGVVAPDDARPVWDDYAGASGVPPARTRVRHLLGTALWSRVEALLSWGNGGDPPEPRDAYHVALACSGLRFVLGLAERAAPGPVREADADLSAAEAALVALWRERDGLAPETQASRMKDVWERLRGDGLRGALAAVLAAL